MRGRRDEGGRRKLVRLQRQERRGEVRGELDVERLESRLSTESKEQEEERGTRRNLDF